MARYPRWRTCGAEDIFRARDSIRVRRFIMAKAMSMVSTTALTMASSPMSDEEVVERVRAGETAWYEILMRRHDQRLYGAARAILGNDGEAEEVMQEAYGRAYIHLRQFDGRAKFSTWLTKIAVHEALSRCRQRCRM